MLLHLPSGKFPFILTSTSYWVPVAVLIVVPFLSALLSVVFGKARVLVALLVALLVARQRLFRGVRDEGQVEFAGPPGPLRYAGVVAPFLTPALHRLARTCHAGFVLPLQHCAAGIRPHLRSKKG